MSKTPIDSVIETSVSFSFSDKNTEPQAVAARNKLEDSSRGFRENLLELGKSVAKILAEKGVMPDVTSETGRKAVEAIWKTAEKRVKVHLKDEVSKGNIKWVLTTLNEIDACDIVVQNLSAGMEVRKVRRSVGMSPGTEAFFHEASTSETYPDDAKDHNSVILGGQSFRKEMVAKVLRGEGKYQPMWRLEDVLIPLISSHTGQLHFVTVRADALPVLVTRINELAPKNVSIEFGGDSDRGKSRGDEPNEDSYFSGAKGKPHRLQLANAYIHITPYDVAKEAGQVTNDQKEESQAQLEMVNESADKIFANGVDGLFIVADGMGGGAKGELASQEAIQTTLGELAKTSGWAQLLPDQIRAKIKEAVVAANKSVFQAGRRSNESLGSTMTMPMVVGGKIYTANVGDSRVYLYKESILTRLTTDHSLVQRMVEEGMITDDMRYFDSNRNQVYRILGGSGSVEVDVSEPIEVSGKVKILTVSDGVWEMIKDLQLKDLLAQEKSSGEIVKDIISAANEKGGEDNITAVVASLNMS